MLRSALLAKLGVHSDLKKSKMSKSSASGVAKKITETSRKVKSKKASFEEEIQALETKYRMNAQLTQKAVEGIITLTSANPKLKNKLFDNEQFPLFIQINSIKVPKGNSRIARIPLKHSLLTPDSEVCLIVPDVKGVPNKDHEEHLEHYKKLLSSKSVTCIKKVMTFHEFRTEYGTFELKSRLVELYDAFLVDGKISGKTVKNCGKIFYQKRKIPTAVKLHVTKLKEHIEQALKKTSLYLHTKGDSFMVQIGHSKMVEKEIVENIFYLVKGLDKEFPGGFINIRNLNLCSFRGITFPIYTTLKNKNHLTIPKNMNESPTVIKEETDELSTRINSGVIVKAT
ncbi:ribosomal L1 domain-containing protein, partial [Asbolus verrucosus]